METAQIDNTPRESSIEFRGCTFLVKIMYAQHASTQGSIQWLEEQKAIYFRSFRELIHLIEDALQNQEEPAKLRTWREANKLRSE
ncbi:MAG: hypothetical protein ACOYEO_02630 [bacterium]|jgi:hypothetical protein